MAFNCFGNQDQNPNDTRGKTFRIAGHVLVGLTFAVAFALVFALLVKLIWNSLMPSIFSFKEITYWQAFGIIILAKLLFGGFGSRRHDYWRKDRREYFAWHKPTGRFHDERPPQRYDRNWKPYTQYWHDEGKAAFEAYMNRIEKEGSAES